MSKRLIRVLSLILTLVMFMSVSTQAFALGGGGLGDGWDRPIGEDEIRDFDGPVEEEEEPTDYFSAYDDQGLAVTVEAPMGALPTLAEVRAERVEAEDIRDAVDAAVEGNPQILLAVDISFWLYGQEIEPEQPVRVKIAAPELEDKTDLTLVHIPDEAEPETIDLIPDSELEFALGTNEIAFESGSFSVYIIVDGEPDPPEPVTYRRTYKFTTDGSTPFEFYDKAGKLVDQQIVKQGDVLEEVILPYSAGHSFQNWVVSASDDALVSVNAKLDLPVTINDDINSNKKDTTVTLKPAYGNVYYVSFHAADLPLPSGDPDIILTKKIVVEGEKVVIGDVVAPQPDASHIFYGWTLKPDGSEPFTTIYDANNQQVKTTEYPDAVTANMDLYPHFVEAYWLRFVANGVRAKYVPAMFAKADQKLTTLPVSSRTGYTFDGWYTVEEDEDGNPIRDDDGNVQFKTQITNGDGNVINPADGLQLTKETVLYGHWTANDNSSYVVVIWRQKVSDDKDAADDEKTYDYAESRRGTGQTDAEVGPTTADTSHSGGDYLGFHYARTVQNSNTIRADGGTVINVYYDRDLIAVNFYYRSGHAPSGSPTAYTYTATTSNDGTQYGVKPDGTYVQLTRGDDSPTTRVYYTYNSGWGDTEYSDTFYTRRGNNNYQASSYSGSNLPPEADTTTYYARVSWIGGTNYYQLTRRTQTVHNYGWSYQDGDETVAYTGTRYTRSTMSTYTNMVTYTGLWGQNFDKYGYTWPSTYEWNEASNGGGTTQTFMTGFVQKENNTVINPYNLYDQNNPDDYKIYHYKQGLDGKYYQTEGTYRFTANGNGGTFHFSNKFEGFTVNSYNTGNNGFNSNGGSNTNMSNTPSTYPLHVYHTRNKWDITYMSTESAASTQMTEVHKEEGIYFEAPLTEKDAQGNVTKTYDLTLAQVGLSERDHYTFTGWYADPDCTSPFNFNSTMPNANVVVYAGWEPVWYQIIVDPDGGEITEAVGATYFWKKYGETFDAYQITRGYIEDPSGEYEYVYVAGEDDLDGNTPSSQRTATYVKQDTGKTKYRLINPAVDPSYSLVGWYVVDEDDNTTSTPYDFGTEVEAPVKIRAVWNLGGDYGLIYNATATVTVKEAEGGTPAVTQVVSGGAPSNTDRYADGAEVVVGAPPTNITPQGFIFDGWEIVEPDTADTIGKVLDDNGGEFYQPGEKLKLNAALWSRTRTIFLRAHYTPVEGSDEPVGVTYLQFQPNFPEGAVGTTGEPTAVKYYPLNSAIELANDEFVPKATDYIYPGYKLIGWSQDKNAEPVVHGDMTLGKIVFGLKDVVGVDGLDPVEDLVYDDPDTDEVEQKAVKGNILYAIWAPVYFYVYHSSNNTVERVQMPQTADGKFDLTALVAEGFMYGGYYSDYLKKGADFAVDKLTFNEDGVATDEGGVAYIGGLGNWTSGNVIKTERGTEMTPVADKVYFLKEVPNDFMKSGIYVIYDTVDNNKVVHNYLITNIDDNNYKNITLIAEDIDTGSRLKLALSFTITNEFTEKTDKINARDGKYFNTKAGYVAVWKPDLAAKDFKYCAAYTTPDGVEVEGQFVREISVGDGTYKEGFGAGGFTFTDKNNLYVYDKNDTSKMIPGQVSWRNS